jgi:hypothetical protein
VQWPQAGLGGATVTGMVAATGLDTTAAADGRGPATRQRQRTDTQGSGQESAGTVDGWKPIVWIAAGLKRPLAVTGVPIHAPAGRSRPALGAPGRTHLAGAARLPQVVVDRGVGAGVARPTGAHRRGAGERPPGGDGCCAGASSRGRGPPGGPPRAHGAPPAGGNRPQGTAGARGGRPPRADHLGPGGDAGARASPSPPRRRGPPPPGGRGAPVAWEGRRPGRHHGVPDQGRGAAAVAPRR